jgi:Flp pilus assembly protein TadG
MLGRIRRRGGEESGVVAVLVAIMLIVFMGMAALAIDLGSFDKAQRQAQAAADAAALAGAQDLTTANNSVAATADAKTYGNANVGSLDSFTVSTPTYNSSFNQITVTVSGTAPRIFSQIWAKTPQPITATAVAQATSIPSTAPGLFADGTACGNNSEGYGIYFNASGLKMPGGFVSNAGIDQSGHNNVFGKSTYVPPCTVNYNGDTTDNTYAGSSAPTTAPAAVPFPNTFPGFPSTCTYGPPPLTTPSVITAANPGTGNPTLNLQNLNGATLPSGTYCYPEVDFNSSVSGSVTFKAATYQLNASEPNLTPFYSGLLIYWTGSGQMNVNGGGDSYLTGGIYAPNGVINLNVPSGTINTFVEAQAIIVSGGPATWNSTLTTSNGGNTFSLVQ